MSLTTQDREGCAIVILGMVLLGLIIATAIYFNL